jgi:hypothetical protein
LPPAWLGPLTAAGLGFLGFCILSSADPVPVLARFDPRPGNFVKVGFTVMVPGGTQAATVGLGSTQILANTSKGNIGTASHSGPKSN